MPNKPIETEVDDTLLSALADGELSAVEVDQACALWRGDAVACGMWHNYQLIGDVLRSDDLASSPGHDRSLFERIRTVLASQPVVLAPTIRDQRERVEPAMGHRLGSQGRHPVWAWAAVMAGGLVVLCSWVLTREPVEVDGGFLADSSPRAPVAVAASAAENLGGGQQVMSSAAINAVLVRDPQLDPYLTAHKNFLSVSVLGNPSGSLRQVAGDVSGR